MMNVPNYQISILVCTFKYIEHIVHLNIIHTYSYYIHKHMSIKGAKIYKSRAEYSMSGY